GQLEAHDIPYYRRKQLKALHHYDEEIIREYFPLPKVLTGMLELCERMFQIRIVERPGVDTWHEDVRYFDVLDEEQPVAGFYLDLYTREDVKMQMKDNFGWTVGIRNRSSVTKTNPLSALIFNFPSPIYGKPSLLSFDDVVMLFQRFGYALQHLLTKVNYSEVAGVSNIEWDAVEVASHVMAHFLYNPTTLKEISSHYATEDPLTDAMVKSIQASRTHLAGYDLCQELYFSALDMELHARKDFWVDVMRELWPRYMTLPLEKKDAHPCSFTPIFSGDWAAAYFSHVWSQVIAADVYSAFHEASNNPEALAAVGRRFRDTFLAMGGACAPAEVFRRFRGRDPSPKALISVLGLKKFKGGGEESGKNRKMDCKNPLENLETNLEMFIENVRQIRIIVSDFQAQGQNVLNQKIQGLVTGLQEIDKLKSQVQNVHVPFEVFDYIDQGKNPQLYTKDCIDKARNKNEEVKGKIDAYRKFKANMLLELQKTFPNEMNKYRAIRGDE
uniref:Peptidase M3A/M3B catalytic domain-containing protein n=2 Tax=Phlebotomus papatasi TaxID=29031 RepID=A0A1B0DHY8_PHLPP